MVNRAFDNGLVLPSCERSDTLQLAPARRLERADLLTVEDLPAPNPKSRNSTTVILSPQKRQRVVSAIHERRVRPRTEDMDREDPSSDNDTYPDIQYPENAPVDVSTDDSTNSYIDFVESVLVGGVGFFQISKTMFVVQGWNQRTGSGSVCSVSSRSVAMLTPVV